MTTLLTQQSFYIRHGVRNHTQFTNLPISDWKALTLPTDSILHYFTNDMADKGPNAQDAIFYGLKTAPMVGHITELNSAVGAPIRTGTQASVLMREYQLDHRSFRIMKNLETATRNSQALVVFNYNLLHSLFKYTRSVFANYYRWLNIFSTMISNIATSIGQTGEHHHYFIAPTPSAVPTVQQFDKLCDAVNQATLEPFADPNSFVFLELWKWLGEKTRAQSLFSKIPKDKIHLVDIIFKDINRWTVVNLGVIDSFRKHAANDTGYILKPLELMTAVQIQKRIIFIPLTMMAQRTKDLSQTLIDDPADNSKKNNEVKEVLAPAATASILVDENKSNDDIQINDEDSFEDLIRIEDEQIEQHLTTMQDLASRHQEAINANAKTVSQVIKTQALAHDEAFLNKADQLVQRGNVTVGQYRRFEKLAEAMRDLVAPDGTPMQEFIQVTAEDVKVSHKPNMADHDVVFDKSQLTNTLVEMEANYVEKVLHKDIAGCVMNVFRAGTAVTEYRVEDVSDYTGVYQHITMKLAPIEGKPSTIRAKIPKITPEGTFKTNGVNYRIRKQRGEIPICKTGPDKVAISSYYGKVFVTRGRKKANDYTHWLCSEITALGMQENSHITELVSADVFDGEQNVGRAYSSVSKSIRSFRANGYRFIFDKEEKLSAVAEDVLKHYETKGQVVCAIGDDPKWPYLVMDKNSVLYSASAAPFVMQVNSDFEEFIKIDKNNGPIEFAEIGIFGKDIPIGVVLGYRMGLSKLMQLLKVTPRRVPAGARAAMNDSEYGIVFSDETLIFNRDDVYANLVLSGFNDWHKSIRTFSSKSFDSPGVYLNLLDSNGLTNRYLREIDLMYDLFVDPITLGLLQEYKEPETFEGLLLRACELLVDDYCLPPGDPRNLRDKGYERMAGALYNELVQAHRVHASKLAKSTQPIELAPYAVWNRITQDPAKVQMSEINPIHMLKELEMITYSGDSGRNRRSMTKKTRGYNKHEMGVTSESTVDSSDVGINFQASANPQYASLRGTMLAFDYKRSGTASLLSTSALLAPGSDQDDPKRVNFVAIQQSHSMPCAGYRQFPLRTGYEAVIGQRTTDLYCATAKKPGLVTGITDRGILIEYTDGEIIGYELGIRHGHAAGLVIPHEIISPLKVGDKVDIGDCIVYNTGFFEPDFFNKKRVVWKNAVMARTVLWESTETLEDASTISSHLANKLETKHTKIKNITVNFNQVISKMITPGDTVEAKTILCYIEDEMTAVSDMFSSDTIDALSALANRSPKAGVKGIVDKIEVLYHGDKEDMSDSIRALANESDKQMKLTAKATGKDVVNGSIDSSFRIDNNPIALDTAVIRVYITQHTLTGVGDKGVLCNQMKTVFSGVMPGEYTSEDGQRIDVIFGQKSIDDRIVHSPIKIGTTSTLLRLAAKRMVSAYKGRKP